MTDKTLTSNDDAAVAALTEALYALKSGTATAEQQIEGARLIEFFYAKLKEWEPK